MMASRAALAPQMEQPNPLINEGSGGAPQKSTNSPELGQEPPSDGPNKGPLPKLSVLPVPRPMVVEGHP